MGPCLPPELLDLKLGVLQAFKEEGQRLLDDQRHFLQGHTVNVESILAQQTARLQKAVEEIVQQGRSDGVARTPSSPRASARPPPAPPNGMPPACIGAPMLSIQAVDEDAVLLPGEPQGDSGKPQQAVLAAPGGSRQSIIRKSQSLQLPGMMVAPRVHPAPIARRMRSFSEDSQAGGSLVDFNSVTPVDTRRISCLSHRSGVGGPTMPPPFQAVDFEEGDDDDDDDDDDDKDETGVEVDGVVTFEYLAHNSNGRHSVQSMDSVDKAEMQAEWNDLVKADIAQTLHNTKSKSVVGQLLQEDNTERWIYTVVTHNAFSSVCACLVITNAAFIGVDTDMAMVRAFEGKEEPPYFAPVHVAFAILFFIELLLRVIAFRTEFIIGPDWKWNVFDTTLVVSSLVELVLESMAPVGFLRVLRGLRMVRVLRLLRIFSLIRDLRLMVCSLMQSFSSLFWALMLLVVITYLSAVFFMQGSLNYIRFNNPSQDFLDDVEQWYRTLPRSFVTFTMCITGGMDWIEAVKPLSRIHWLYESAFILYILIVVIGVLNVLTGIFVERAQELSGLDPDLIIQGEIKRNKAFLAEMKGFFEEADADKSGMISWEEFKEYVRRKDIQAYLATQQLDAYDARQLWNILNLEDNHEVNIDDFIFGCMRLKGSAKSVDVVALLQESRKHQKKMKDAICCLEEQLKTIAGAVGAATVENSALSRRTSFAFGRNSRRPSHLP